MTINPTFWTFFCATTFCVITVITCKNYKEGDNSDIFSSTFQMQTLLQAEIKFVNHLRKHVEDLESRAEKIKSHLGKFYDHGKWNPGDNLGDYVAHPVNSFGIVARTSDALANLVEELLTPNNSLTQR
jgi:hypothetical protein